MILTNGEKVFIITRRIFEGGLRRHFVGEVQESTDSPVRVRGYAFVYDSRISDFLRREGLRTRILSLVDTNYVINLLPLEAIIEDIHYQVDADNQRMFTNDKTFNMNISEFSAHL
jgi:hypothetical protein